MKPLAILPLQTMPNLPEDLKKHYDFSGNDSGWITGPILKNWIENQLVQYVHSLHNESGLNEPALIILDNHSSRN